MTSLIFRFAAVSGQAVEWRLARGCAVAPPSAAWRWAWALPVALALALASIFKAADARWALSAGGCAAVLWVLALVRYGRHAADGERISLQGRRLVVEKETAGRLERAEFDRAWVHVEPKAGDRSLITLSAHGRSVEVGRYVRPELRPALASEIRRALRAA